MCNVWVVELGKITQLNDSPGVRLMTRKEKCWSNQMYKSFCHTPLNVNVSKFKDFEFQFKLLLKHFCSLFASVVLLTQQLLLRNCLIIFEQRRNRNAYGLYASRKLSEQHVSAGKQILVFLKSCLSNDLSNHREKLL